MTRDTVNDFGDDQTPTEPGKAKADRLPPPTSIPGPGMPRERQKRESLGIRKALGEAVRKVIPYLTALLIAFCLMWTARIDRAADQAQDTAENAEAKGTIGAAVASKTKKEAQAGYDVTKEKVDATGEVLAKMAAELKALREDVERMKARAGRPARRRAPAVKVPPAVTEPLPATPAAAAQEKAGGGA